MMRTALLVIMSMLSVAGNAMAQSAPLPHAPLIGLSGAMEVMFDPKLHACDGHDVPDVSPRAYRDDKGNIRLFTLHFENRALIGPTLDKLKLDCRVVFRGSGSADPAAFDDRNWIAATWTKDGKTIHGLAHHEFQANTHPGRCAFKEYMSCWYNTILALRSDNSGESFTKAAKPVVASAPFKQDVQQGRHRGFFNPSNIVTDGVWHYMLASTTGWDGQGGGVCLFRTDNIADPSRWRAFDGATFETKFVDPNREKPDPAKTCMTLNPFPAPVGSVTRHRASGQWIAVFQAQKDDKRFASSGIYAAASKDLKTWSAARLILPTKTLYDDACGVDFLNSYPTLLDDTAQTRNFEDTGDTPWLYLSRMAVKGCEHTSDRKLVRVKVKLG